MKTQQITAILMCALVGSTLSHEFLRAKQFAPEPRSSRLASPFEDRILPVTEGGQLQMIWNEIAQILGVYNATAKVALIIDITTNLVGVFDGSNGAVFILNLKSQTGVYIPGGLTKISWISSQSTFEIFFSKIASLQVFLNLKIGQTFSFSNISNETLEILGQLVTSFSANIGTQIQINIRTSLTILVEICVSITTLLTGSLKGLLAGAGNGLITLYGDLIWLCGVLEGLGALFTNISGGLAAVLAAKIRIDLIIIFRAASGLELLVNMLIAFTEAGKISLLASLLSSIEKILALILQLGGNVSTGVTGLFEVILYIYLLIGNKIKLDVFLPVLSQYCASRASGEALDLNVDIQGLLRIIGQSSELTVLVAFLQNLQAGKLVLGNLNISEIIDILLNGGVTNALRLVVLVLLKLTVVVGYEIGVTIPALLLFLLNQLRTVAGIIQLNLMGIGIPIPISGDNIIEQLIKGLDLKSIINKLLGGFSVEKLTRSISILEPIFNTLSAVLQELSGGSISLTKIVESSSLVQSQILEFCKQLAGLIPTQDPGTSTGGGLIGGILGGIVG